MKKIYKLLFAALAMENKIKKLLKFQFVLFLICTISGLSGCVMPASNSRDSSLKFPNDSRVDQSFLSGQPCKSPCWYGLKIGESNIEEIQATLPVLPFIDAASMKTQRFGSDPHELLFLANCVYSNPHEDCVWLETSSNGILRKIILKIYYPLPLGSAIQQLGTPAYYVSNPVSGRDACSVHIYWPDASVIASLEVASQEKYCIGEESERLNLESQIEALIFTVIETQQDGTPWMENR